MARDVMEARRIPYHRLIWLMPPAFACHIAEEFVGGFPRWVTHVIGGSMDLRAFILNNILFMGVLIGLTAWASIRRSMLAVWFLTFWASANLSWDALFHLAMVPAYDRYSPGLITAVLLYLPLSVWIAAASVYQGVIRLSSFAAAVGCGAILMGFVIWYGLYHFAV